MYSDSTVDPPIYVARFDVPTGAATSEGEITYHVYGYYISDTTDGYYSGRDGLEAEPNMQLLVIIL